MLSLFKNYIFKKYIKIYIKKEHTSKLTWQLHAFKFLKN